MGHAIGGQAVIEGVMMKSRRGWSVAVRGPKGDIHVKTEHLRKLPAIYSMPFVRGVLVLLHTLTIGIKALEFSASKAYDDEGGDEPLSKTAITLTIAASIGLAVVLFIIVPLYAAKLTGMAIEAVAKGSLLFNLVDGVARVVIFLLYILVVGMWAEMRRVFEYHGAEHKVIHAYEAGRTLDVESVRGYSTRHPRCGTSFLMIVMVLSILIFSLIPNAWPFVYKALSRFVLIPVIAGISYEALKFSAKMKDNTFVSAMIMPGLLLQRLTTFEPDDAQLEVAIRAMREVLDMEAAPDA